ncbi:DUF3465 domain-containing protein [Desulfomarina sp.]
MNKKPLLLFVVLLMLFLGNYFVRQNNNSPADGPSSTILSAWNNHTGNIQVSGSGRVIKLLPDDNRGTRHQKFIVKVDRDLTVLIAHNIDLAPRVKGLKKGDTVSFYGEYEWNKKGGVIHWTHHDPGKKHPDGWLQLNGRKYW